MRKKKELRVGIKKISTNLSPFRLQTTDYEIARALFAPFFKFKRNFLIESHIIESFSHSQERNSYIFKLSDKIYFHNNRKANANDLEFSLVRGMLKGARKNFSQLLSIVKGYESVSKLSSFKKSMCEGIKVLDNLTIQITLKEPSPIFLRYFTRTAISLVPQEEFEQTNIWKWKTFPVGCGSYKFYSISEDKRELILEKNEKFFSFSHNAPDRIYFIAFKDPNEIDLISDQEYISDKEFEYSPSAAMMTIAIEHYSLNDNDAQWHDLRHLINEGINKKELLESLPNDKKKYYTIANQFLPSIIGSFSKSEYKLNNNFEQKKEAFLSKWKTIPEINVLIYTAYSVTSDLYFLQTVLFEKLRKIGLPVSVLKIDSLDQELDITKHHVLLSSSAFNFCDPEDLSLFLMPSNEIYRSHSNPLCQIRSLLSEGRKNIDMKARNRTYKKLINVLDQSALIYPIAYTNEFSFIRRNIIEPSSFYGENIHPFYESLQMLN